MKDAYESYDMFEEIKEMLHILHRLFKNSGKSWRLFQQVGENVGIATYRYAKVGGTRFQTHTLSALNNFIRNFLVNLNFVENAEEHGNGKNCIVSREIYPKLVGIRRKWEKCEFSGIVQLFLVVLKQTSFLSSTMETDAILIYQLYDAIEETIEKLNEIANESSVEYEG